MNGPRLLAALKALLPHTDAIEDEGPIGTGWQSDELVAARAEAEAAIAEAEEEAKL